MGLVSHLKLASKTTAASLRLCFSTDAQHLFRISINGMRRILILVVELEEQGQCHLSKLWFPKFVKTISHANDNKTKGEHLNFK